jgi:hypothetical protein
MARSTYVYTVTWMQPKFDGPVTIGTYTVKHEMLGDIGWAIEHHGLPASELRIYRHRDGDLNIAETGSGVDITAQFTFPPTP